MKTRILSLFTVLFTATSFGQITNGLVAKMPFTYGSVYDEVGNNQGYIVGATPTTDRFGIDNMAYEFDGNDYIYFYHTAATNLDLLNEISISVFIRPDDFSSGMRAIVSKWNDATNEQYGLYQNGTNGIYAVRTVNSGGMTAAITPGPNPWYHVVFTLNKLTTEQNLYINGVLISTITPTGTITPTTSSTYFSVGAQYNDVNGVAGTPNRFFIGGIDDIQIFDRVVTAAEVQTLYQADKPVCDGFDVAVLQTTHTGTNTGSITFNVDGGHAPYTYTLNAGSAVNITSSKVCNGASEGNSMSLTAPGTATFRAVNFASYGTPNGTCPNFTYTNCHLLQSFTAAEDSLLGNSVGNYLGANSTFGGIDPCFGTGKSTQIMASYAEDVTISNLTPGSYDIAVADSLGCIAEITVVINDLALAVNETSKLSFAVYPNPTNSTFKLTTSTPTQFRILNVAGEVVYTFSASTTAVIDISDLNTGIYFIQTQSGETIKLVKI